MPVPQTIPPAGFVEWWEKNVTVQPRKTLEDWRALPEGTRAELINGTLVMSPAPRVEHQIVAARLFRVFDQFVEKRDLGIVLPAPLDVALGGPRGFQPDVVFIAADRLHILGEQEVEGAPDLVAEVLSPSTAYYDVTAKRLAYAQAGVRELWYLDPGEKTVDVLTLGEDDFVPVDRAVGEGTVASRLLDGLEVSVPELFRWPGT